jgi:hypothetical protein
MLIAKTAIRKHPVLYAKFIIANAYLLKKSYGEEVLTRSESGGARLWNIWTGTLIYDGVLAGTFLVRSALSSSIHFRAW